MNIKTERHQTLSKKAIAQVKQEEERKKKKKTREKEKRKNANNTINKNVFNNFFCSVPYI